ncbi:MAG: copper oxidase [Methylococcales bacterium]
MNRLALIVAAIAVLAIARPADAQEPEQVIVKPFEGESKVHMSHEMDMQGMVMNENPDRLPAGCPEISEDVEFTIHAGRKYADRFPGTLFSYDQQEWDVKPCSRIKVNFFNEDPIRHQFMIHGLPEYLYPPTGMFHIELNGLGNRTASFIVPNEKKTFLVHCELSQHMEKGMKAQLKVGGGDGDLPSIPGLTGSENPDRYPVQWNRFHWFALALAALLGMAAAYGGGLYFKK